MMYAVLTGIALWAKYKNTPLNVMLIIAKEIQARKRSGWVPESVNPNGHPISKIAAIMRNSQCILIRDCRLILRNWYWLTRVCHQRLLSSAFFLRFVVFWAVFYFVRTQLSLAWGIMFDRYAAMQPGWVLPLQFSLPIELRLLYGCRRRLSRFPFS